MALMLKTALHQWLLILMRLLRQPEQGVLRTGHNLLMGGPSEHEWKPLQSRAPLQRRHIIFIQRNISRKLLAEP
jgi:hypothetical protein